MQSGYLSADEAKAFFTDRHGVVHEGVSIIQDGIVYDIDVNGFAVHLKGLKTYFVDDSQVSEAEFFDLFPQHKKLTLPESPVATS